MKKACVGLLVLVVVCLSSSTVLAQATMADAQAAIDEASGVRAEATNDQISASNAKTVAWQQYDDAVTYYKAVYIPAYGSDMNIDAFLDSAYQDLEGTNDDLTFGQENLDYGTEDQANAVIAMTNMNYDVAVNQATNAEAWFNGADTFFLDATDKICDAQIWIAYAMTAMGL